MAVSGTYTFSPDIGEIAEEAYERAGLELANGYDLRTARRSLDLLFLEWQNRGINLWTVDEQKTSTLTADVATVTLASNTVAVLEMVLRENDGDATAQSDIELSRISRDTYYGIPTKLSTGRPTQVYIDRKVDSVTATLWQVPDKSGTYTLVYNRVRRMADAGPGGTYTADVPDRFWPALISGLAYKLALKRPEASGRVPILKQDYEEQFGLAAAEDREKAPLRFVPGGYR
jgi:hypothetical protein